MAGANEDAGRESYEDFLTQQLDGLKAALLAHHEQSKADGEDLLERRPSELMQLLDKEPMKFLERSTLTMAPSARWRDFTLEVLARSNAKKVPEVERQMMLLEPWTSQFTAKSERQRSVMMARSPSVTLGDIMLESNPFLQKIMLTPHGNIRLAWTFLGLLAICWDLIFIPLQMFDINVEVDDLINVMSIAIFIYWVLDVPATFLTGYDRGGILEMRLKPIARNYLKGWLGLDVIVLLLDVLIFAVLSINTGEDGGDSVGSFRIARALRLMRFLRLLRLHKMATLAAEILDRFKTDSFLLTMNILRSLAAVLALNHYMSCAFLALAVFAEEGQMTWIKMAGLQETDFWTKYLSALHWTLTQFMPATQNIAPNTAEERIFAIFVVLTGLAVFSSFVSGVTNTVNQLRQIHTDHFKQESKMKSFLTQKSVSVDVWCRVQKFCRLRLLLNKISLKESDIPMLRDLPQGLRLKLHQEIYMPVLMSAPWMSPELALLDHELMAKLCDKVMKEKVASAMQELFMEGVEATEVVIPTSISNRSLVYFSSRLEHHQRVEEGTWLCELCLWAHWEHRGQLEAGEVAHYMVINGVDFATTVAGAGGPLAQLIRTLGLLYISLAEREAELTDLPLEKATAQDFMDRAARFGQLRLPTVRRSKTSFSGLFRGGNTFDRSTFDP